MKSSNLHIVFLPSWYPQTPQDLTGSFFREQAISLSTAGIKVGVININTISLRNFKSLIRPNSPIKPSLDQGVYTYSKSIKNWFFKFPFLRSNQFARKGLIPFKAYIKEHGLPDVIHVHSMLYAGSLAVLIKKKYGIPYVISEHSSAFSRELISPANLKFLETCSENAVHRFGVSQLFANKVEKTIGAQWGKWEEMPNSVSDKFLKYPLLKKNNTKFNFIHVSFMTQNKRVCGIIQSFRKALEKHPDISLTLVGDGECRQELEALVKELNIENNVHFTGKLSRQDVLENINKADVFIMNSEHESFGVVLIEALALGKFVISTKTAGAKSIITPEVGCLIDLYDSQGLENAMSKIISEIDSFPPKKIRDYCWQKYSSEILIKKWIGIYKTILL